MPRGGGRSSGGGRRSGGFGGGRSYGGSSRGASRSPSFAGRAPTRSAPVAPPPPR